MRKLYSIVLTACALLLSTSLFAVEPVGNLGDLQTAINKAAGGTVEIKLTDDITVENTDSPIIVDGDVTVKLDLSGHNIFAHQERAIELYHGTLEITGNGTVTKNDRIQTFNSNNGKYSYSKQDAIAVFGNKGDVANWSNLTIDEGVKIIATGDKVPADDKGDNGGDETANGICVLDALGDASHGNWTKGSAYGVNIEIKGTVYGSKYGIKINGTIKETTGNIPSVKVYPNAEVSAAPNSSNSIAIYSSGYGVFEISGKVHAATGVYIKSGKVDLNNADVASDYTLPYTEPAGQGSGVNAGGSAIVVESNASYNGGQELKIEGDTKVTGSTGYAIEEAVTTANNSYVESVTISGGTVVAGKQGTAIVTKDGAEKVTVVGGNFGEGLYIKDGNSVSKEDDDYFVPATGYITTTIQDEKGRTITVVTEGTAPKGEESVANATTASVNWIGTEETLDAPKNLDYLEINANKPQVLTVKEGVTLTVGRVVMGNQAQIIVKAGARLIVDGKQGIVAPVASNIILETQEGKPAQFLFNPAVTSNRHPNATVEFATKSRREEVGGQTIRVYQRFGIPTHTAVTNIESDAAIQTAIYNFDWTANEGQGDWVVTGVLNNGSAFDYSKLNKPFESYQMLTNTANEGTVYKMKGELFGNDNATMEVHANAWHAFSNSYVANIGIENLVKNGNYANVWVYRRVGTGYAWDAVGKKDFENWFSTPAASKKIEPMQAFYVKGGESPLTMNIDYADMVWGVRNASLAPQRRSANEDVTLAQISVSNASYSNLDNLYLIQSDEFSAEYEDGYDAEKMMNDAFSLYVTSDMMLQSVATDNLENTYIGVKTAQAGEYTLAFGNIAGEELALKDLISGEVVNMQEGGEYTFYAAGNNDYRFQIVKRQNVVTDVENVENGMKDGGIYTLTGMYLGNMSVWNTLPAGVYVVNGEKRVK